jgi:hypothetical protein
VRWDLVPGEVKWANVTVAPDGKSAGYYIFQGNAKDEKAAEAAFNKLTPAQQEERKSQVPGVRSKPWRKGWLQSANRLLRPDSGTSQWIPMRKHGNPKGIEWCDKNKDSKKDLCDQVKAKYEEVEKLEAETYDLQLKKSKHYWYVGHTTQFGWKANKRWKDNARNTQVQIGEADEVLIPKLQELADLNDKVTR